MGVAVTGVRRRRLHHHDGGGKGGHVHDDPQPGLPAARRRAAWTLRSPGYAAAPPASTPSAQMRARRPVRAVAVLYLCNEPWSPGRRRRACYRHHDDPATQPVATVPPMNNTLFAFECTPHSFHAFQASMKCRNWVIMWLHRPWGDAVRRWRGGDRPGGHAARERRSRARQARLPADRCQRTTRDGVLPTVQTSMTS